MSKVFWDEERMESTIRIFGDILGYDIEVEAHPMNEWYYSVIDDHKALVAWETVGSKYFYFSPEMCNHKDMPDEYIISAVAYFVCLKVILYYMMIKEGKFFGNKLFPDSDELTSVLKDMFGMIGVNYYERSEIEDKIRPVRKDVFALHDNGGSFFMVGDLLRREYDFSGSQIYTITDICSQGDEIKITCESVNDVITIDEAEAFRSFELHYEPNF